MKKLFTLLLIIVSSVKVFSQSPGPGDTIVVKTFNYKQTYGVNQWSPGMRDTTVNFPNNPNLTFEKILMLYNLRCKGAKISNSTQRDQGCGEWDASCNTYITDATRYDSVKMVANNYVINDFAGSVFNYRTKPTYNYYKYTQPKINYTSVVSEKTATVGTGVEVLSYPFSTAKKTGRSQYLWTASELTAAGLTAGNITGMKLNISAAGSNCNFLSIGMKGTNQTSLSTSAIELYGFNQVYFSNTTLQTGSNFFKFYQPFNWDGVSNIAIEVSYTNPAGGTNSTILGENTAKTMGLYTTDDDSYLSLNGSSYLNLGKYNFISGAKPRTIELWSKVDVFNNAGLFQAGKTGTNGGDFSLRTETAVDSWKGQLWGTGYDFSLNLATSKGAWHHYAMSYDGSNVTVYYDGEVAGQNTAAITTLLQDAWIGRWDGGGFLNGSVDEVRVWNVALAQTTIKEWKNRAVTSSHPNFANLYGDYRLNLNLNDNAVNTNGTAKMNGLLAYKSLRGNELKTNFETTTKRPNITFVQGVYVSTLQNTVVLDSVKNDPKRVIRYNVNRFHLAAVDTNYYYQANYAYTYNGATNTKIDSVLITPSGTINISQLNCYDYTPARFEIMSFVTPYGLGLDLGPNGKTWTFDVSDYAPILQGSRRITVDRGGQWMEDMDIKFLFIVGTPPKKVLDIKQLWRIENNSKSYADIAADNAYPPVDVKMLANASSFKVRSSITGHGQEGEFIPRTHFLDINGGADEFAWQVWKKCGENPIYPQGGTWIYDRAGWCPGMATTTTENDITPYVTPGQIANIDYGIYTATGASNYLVNNQLVSYGNANFSLDAAIVDVSAPSDKVEYSRTNSICSNPKVIIKNTGTTPLTSLTIEYWVNNAQTRESYTWTGNLGFLEKTEVTLPSPASLWAPVRGLNNTFYAEIKKPNSGTDAYQYNNKYTSKFTVPAVVPANFYIWFTSNNAANETRYQLFNDAGVQLFNRSGMINNTQYKDTFNLAKGCYTLKFIDAGGNGISFWANTAAGNGSAKIMKVGGGTVKTFNPDFGSSLIYSFTIDSPLSYEELYDQLDLNFYPNPATTEFIIEGNDLKDAQVKVLNTLGQEVKVPATKIAGRITFNTSQLAKGMYFVNIQSRGKSLCKKVIVE